MRIIRPPQKKKKIEKKKLFKGPKNIVQVFTKPMEFRRHGNGSKLIAIKFWKEKIQYFVLLWIKTELFGALRKADNY